MMLVELHHLSAFEMMKVHPRRSIRIVLFNAQHLKDADNALLKCLNLSITWCSYVDLSSSDKRLQYLHGNYN